MKELYTKEVRKKIQDEFKIKNPMAPAATRVFEG